eukprot:COSAG01_NODE_5469_length_4241_cov_7.343312_2_plen_112_part_00
MYLRVRLDLVIYRNRGSNLTPTCSCRLWNQGSWNQESDPPAAGVGQGMLPAAHTVLYAMRARLRPAARSSPRAAAAMLCSACCRLQQRRSSSAAACCGLLHAAALYTVYNV